MNKKLLLIDGHSMLNRAFYGVPDLTSSDGTHTGAVYGFVNIMLKVLEDENPGFFAVAFDESAPTFRHEIYAEYKGTRKPMPEELHQQVPLMKKVLGAMGVPVLSKPGLEADDILGTTAARFEKNGYEVTILSGDRDLLQLVTDHTKVLLPRTVKGQTTVTPYYADDVLREYEVPPKGIIELKALMGDTSDNIPGVPKIGPKTATELLKKYGNIDVLKEHIPEVTKKSIRESLEQNFELAELSRKLATINTDADIELNEADAEMHDLFTEEAYQLIRSLELKSLLKRFGDVASAAEEKRIRQFEEVLDLGEVESCFAEAAKAEVLGLAVDFESEEQASAVNAVEKPTDEKKIAEAHAALMHGDAGDAVILGVAIVTADHAWYIPRNGFVSPMYLMAHIASLMEKSKGTVYVTDLKNILKKVPFNASAEVIDLEVADYLLDPLRNDYGTPVDAKSGALLAFEKGPAFKDEIEKQGMTALLKDIELPLTRVLSDMECSGIRVMPEELKRFSTDLGEKMAQLEKEIYEGAGDEFNVNSPKQLGEILFGKMQLPGGKKTKTGYSTSAAVLEKLAPEVPFVQKVLDYRQLAKLKATYADGLTAYIGAEDRIHSTFNQTITATGRISSADPNLQNIPVRTELGREFRKVFIPRDGFCFTDADYSQIELRILASMSGDEKLIDAYKQDEDIHAITASQVFHLPLSEVTPEIRRNAKAVNFGIVYGISSFGLSQGLSITRSEAKEYIDRYFETYPGVKKYLDGLVSSAKEKGYAETYFHRRRPMPELKSSNFMQRSFGERVAMNAPIQGTAADIIKIAMVRVAKALKDEGLESRLILQVHDELLIETKIGEEEKVAEILKREMMGAADMAVPLVADVKTGMNWFEAH
ncbi:DNA polymerase I [Lachnospiraceae bacterium]|nr:DNA polymerase I [Lachnospiraceae bacterium]